MAERRTPERRPAERRRPESKAVRGTLPPGEHPQTLDFRRKNWLLLGGGVLSIVLGFLVLSTGDITLAPILLLLGYLVLIPWALVARPSAPRDSAGEPPKIR